VGDEEESLITPELLFMEGGRVVSYRLMLTVFFEAVELEKLWRV